MGLKSKLLIILLFLVLSLGFLMWLFLYSSLTANILFTIPLRRGYQEIYWKTESYVKVPERKYPPFDPIYTFVVQPPKGDIYALFGKFESLDSINGIVSIKGYDGKIYNFQFGENLKKLDNKLLPDSSFSVPENQEVKRVLVKNNIISVDSKPYSKESRVEVQWDDNRSLLKILQDYSKNPLVPLNNDSEKLFTFIKRD